MPMPVHDIAGLALLAIVITILAVCGWLGMRTREDV